jgi:hypothetical protein
MRYQVKLTISLLLLWIFLLPSVTNLYGQDKPRIVVALFKYPGDIVTFTQFREMLSKKLLLLGGEFGNKHQYIRGLHCFDTQTSAPSKVEIIQSYWKSSDALEVMSGIILNENNRNLVSSTVYLFELKGSLSKDFITLKFPVASKQYQHTKDTHSIISV